MVAPKQKQLRLRDYLFENIFKIIGNIEHVAEEIISPILFSSYKTMTSAYLAISILKKSPIPEKQLKVFLSYLPQAALKEYSSKANIYNGRRNMSKNDLMDMIISDKDKNKIYTSEGDDLTQEEINNLLTIIRNSLHNKFITKKCGE